MRLGHIVFLLVIFLAGVVLSNQVRTNIPGGSMLPSL